MGAHEQAAQQTREYMTTKAVSEETGVPVGTLRFWRHVGEGPASFTMGRRVVYRRQDVEAWINAQMSATLRGGVA